MVAEHGLHQRRYALSRRPGRVPVARLVPRAFLLVVGGHAAGGFASTLLIGSSRSLSLLPYVGFLVPLCSGLAAGIGLGLLLRGERVDRLGRLVLGAGWALLLLTVFAVVRATQMADAVLTAPPWGELAVVVVIAVAVQCAVAWALWTSSERLQ